MTTEQIKNEPTPVKAPKTFSVRLTAGVEEVVVSAWKTKAGWKSAAVRYREAAVKGKKRRGERGATQEHATADAAKAAIEKLAAGFVKIGWVRPERKGPGGFVAKPDAFGFNNLPRPSSKK